MMMVYVQIVDSVNQDKKDTMQGQMSLFDIADEDQKKNYKMQMPNVGEYDNDQKLEFEKEVIGIYASWSILYLTWKKSGNVLLQI